MASIKKVYTQSIPAVRFIGKKYGDSDRVNGNFGAKWDEAFQNGMFKNIEDAAGSEEIFEDSTACIGLMRVKGSNDFEYWIGMFRKADSLVPEGYGYVDFPASKIGVCWVYGSAEKGDIYCQEEEVIAKLKEQGYSISRSKDGYLCVFERYANNRFMPADENGNVILDVCTFIE